MWQHFLTRSNLAPMSTIETLRDRANDVRNRYYLNFAGHPRVTRDLDQLLGMIRVLEQIRREGQALAAHELVAQVGDTLGAYQAEVEQIQQAQAGGPLAIAAARLTTGAQLQIDRYRRNFAYRARDQRDGMLLKDIVDTSAGIEKDMVELLAQRPTDENLRTAFTNLQEHLRRYRLEQRAIRDQQAQGSPSDRANRLAALSNDVFARYRAFFAKKTRVSRNPAQLTRFVDQLQDILDGMTSLRFQGFQAEQNNKNISVVEQTLALYRTEIDRIRQAKADVGSRELAGALAAAANERFEEFRSVYPGNPRAQVEIGPLETILEDLYWVYRSMDELDRSMDNESNSNNLRTVEDRIRTYHREWLEIDKVQNPRSET